MTNEALLRGLRAMSLCALAVGCAGMGANKKAPGTIADGMFKPALPPAQSYGPNPAYVCNVHGAMGAVNDALKGQKVNNLETDGRACAMAETLLGWNGEDNVPPGQSVRAFLSQYFGMVTTVEPRGFILQHVDVDESKDRAEFDKEKDLAEHFIAPIADFAGNAARARWGMAVDRTYGAGKVNKWHVVVVMFDEAVAVEPIPRELPAGGTATLTGKVEAANLSGIKVQIVDTTGALTKPAAQGMAFSAPIACGDRNGRVLVQVGGDKQGGGEVQLASFPISCGAPMATSVAMPTEDKGPLDVAASAKKIADSINADRAAANLKPLDINAGLTQIATKIADARAKGQGISDTELNSDLKAKDFSAAKIAESAAQAFSVEDTYTAIANNPPDRANILSTDLTSAGVGVARGAEIGGKPTVIVILLFVKENGPADPAAVKAKMYEAIAKKRASASLNAVDKDDALAGIAQKYADAAAAIPSGTIPREKESEILAPLYASSMSVNELGGWTADETNALAVADQVIGKGKLVGVGVAVGRSEQFGKNSVYVMVLLGERLTPAKTTGKPARKKK